MKLSWRILASAAAVCGLAATLTGVPQPSADAARAGERTFRMAPLGMTADQLRLALADAMPPYDAVYTGYSSYRVECKNVLAFGGEKTETLFAGLGDDGIVVDLWCSDAMPQLLLLPLKEQLLLADRAAGGAERDMGWDPTTLREEARES